MIHRLFANKDHSCLHANLFEQFERCASQLLFLGVQAVCLSLQEREDFLSELSFRQKTKLLSRLECYNQFLEELSAQPSHLRTNQAQLWLGMKKLGLRGHSQLLGDLSHDENEVFEIYDLQGVQVFRNVNFFDHSFYSLEVIFTQPLFYLYDRPQNIETVIQHQVALSVLGLKNSRYFEGVPQHIIREKNTRERQAISLRLGLLAPLRSVDSLGPAGRHVLVSSIGHLL